MSIQYWNISNPQHYPHLPHLHHIFEDPNSSNKKCRSIATVFKTKNCPKKNYHSGLTVFPEGNVCIKNTCAKIYKTNCCICRVFISLRYTLCIDLVKSIIQFTSI